ncbi:MAG: ABC transporter substrate-binding protein [Nakamurella sp.]
MSIASLSPTATEMLYAIGAGDQVTVVDKNADYPADLSKARVDAYQLNVEALTAYKPDLVVTVGSSPDQEAKFKALGMTMIAETAPANLDGTYAQINQLGQVTGHAAEAAALVTKMKGQVAAIAAQAPVETRPLTYYYELDQTYYSVTSATFIGSVLADLGLVSIADKAKGAAAAGGYPQLDSEFILRANPDYIFLADTICCGQSAASVKARDGWSALSAVSDGRILELNDNIASRWGPRIVDLLESVAAEMKEHAVPQ